MGANLIWQPTNAYIEGSHLQRLMNRHGLPDVAALQARGAADPAWFWEAVVQDLGLRTGTSLTSRFSIRPVESNGPSGLKAAS